MQREQYPQVAIAAGALAIIAAALSGRLPRWLRITLVLGLVILASGAGLFAYRYVSEPTTLTVAAGSLDGDVPRIMSAIAARMASTKAAVPLKVIDEGTTAESAKVFAEGKADLAVARGDTVDLSIARTVLTVTHGVVLIVVPPGSSIASMDDLKGKAGANSETELAETERCIDEIFKGELEKHAKGDAEATDTGALGLAMQRLDNSIAQRRAILNGSAAAPAHA